MRTRSPMLRGLRVLVGGAAFLPNPLLAEPPSPPAKVEKAATPADMSVTAEEARRTVLDLAQKLEDNYVFPDVAKRYAATLRANAANGAYDALISGRALAARLTEDLRAVSPDAHLRVVLRPPSALVRDGSAGSVAPRPAFPWKPIEEASWLAPGIAYIRFNIFPGDEATVGEAKRFMEEHATAKVIIFDNRTHHGGGLDEMNAMFPYLFSAPTTLVTMDTRASAADRNPEPGLRRVPAPDGIIRDEHFVVPSRTEKRLFNAKVFVLTSGATGSAAEHMTLALKHTRRATIVGETTAGAGHYGGEQPIGDKFAAFIPVGRTFDPDTGKDWEGTGIAPDVPVQADQALIEALVRSGLSRAAAERINATIKPSGSMARRVARPA